MNKRNVEGNMDAAIQAIKEIKDTCGDIINQSMRGKMSAFGAAVMMSGVAPAVAYYAKNEPNVLNILCKMYEKTEHEETKHEKLFQKEKEDILEKAVSVKLAMNLFIKDNNNGESDGKTEE